MSHFTPKENRRRYRLHRAVRRLGYAVNARQHLISTEPDGDGYPDKVMALKNEFNYKFQIVIIWNR